MIRLPADHGLHRLARTALLVGAAAGVVCLIGLAVDGTQLVRSWLFAWVYWTQASLGAVAILMINHVTGGAWGAAIRRFLESMMRLLPLLAVAFVPIALGLPAVYEWAHADAVAHDAILAHKSAYLNAPFFLARTAGYFVVWIVVARALGGWSDAQDATTDAKPTERLELLSRGGLLVMGLTMSFASVDWVMSLEPHWFSTIYGVLFMGGSVLTAMALAIVLAALARPGTRLPDAVSPDQFHDLGRLLLAFTMLWAYFHFSQFLIIWSGNLPEEIGWYLKRTAGGWRIVTILLVSVQFVLPFVILLSRDVKRRPAALAAVAGGMLVARLLDVYWLVVPAFPDRSAAIHWLDVAAFLAIGGPFVALAIRGLAGRSLVPLHDPSLPLEAEHA